MGICSCKAPLYRRNKCNAEIRWKEHCSHNDKKSEVAEHLSKNPDHATNWQVITSAPPQRNKQKIPGTYYITKFKPTLNNQLDIKIKHRFGNCIT